MLIFHIVYGIILIKYAFCQHYLHDFCFVYVITAKTGRDFMNPRACAITGHRPTRFCFGYNEDHPLCKEIKERLFEQFQMLHDRENVQTFFVGGALGVDMWAGEQLLALKEKSGYENIEIIVAIPFVGHDSKWPEQSQKRLKSLIQKATNCIVVSQEANTASYKKRNYYMVDHADFLVGVFDNAKQMRSGTAQTVNYALRQGKQIILIHPDTADTAYLR